MVKEKINTMPDTQNTLQQLRQEIDTIDQEITDLLAKRIDVVKQVGHYKKANNKTPSFIRSAREATMVIDLIDKLKENYHPQAILNIWRTIIASSLSVEQGLEIVVYSEHMEQHAGYWLARDYFGNFNPIDCVNSMDLLFKRLSAKSGIVAVLPYPSNEQNWWRLWLDHSSPKPKVFSIIPYIRVQNINDRYLAIANLEPEDSGNETTLLAVKTGHDIKSIMHKNANIKILVQESDNNAEYFLLEVAQYIHEEHTLFLDLKNQLGTIAIIGSYAQQLNYCHKE